MKKIIISGLIFALLEAVYVFLVALFMNSANKFLGPGPDGPNGPNMIGIVIFLLIFVLSAAVSGALILGRPILLYLDNKKREALELFGATLGWIFILLVILLIILAQKF
ncbi:MAG: hypothetical protein NTZ97_04225 [Candidatus Moranbacteria bacterium]|nr:hypothetical protein [Candidatus Moranbacteria bacterium]